VSRLTLDHIVRLMVVVTERCRLGRTRGDTALAVASNDQPFPTGPNIATLSHARA
jgi:hypothetical protein